MASMKIPDEDFPALVFLAKLEDKSFRSLSAALSEITPSLTKAKYTKAILSKVPEAEAELVPVLLNTIYSLVHIVDTQNIAAKKLATAIAESASDSKEFGQHFKGKSGEVFATRLVELLDGPGKSIGVVVKALNVVHDHERTFCKARILSDIRPIFDSNADKVVAAVVVHNLQIGYHDSAAKEHRETYFALDESDLDALKLVIERAQKKQAAMKGLITASKTQHIDV